VLNADAVTVYIHGMKYLCSISLVTAALLAGCETQKNAANAGNAEQRELARRTAARQQESADESQQNLMRAQQNVVNRDGNSSRNLSGY
jgi:hypothetical protein